MFQDEFEKGEFSFIFVKENDGENILEDISNFITNKLFSQRHKQSNYKESNSQYHCKPTYK